MVATGYVICNMLPGKRLYLLPRKKIGLEAGIYVAETVPHEVLVGKLSHKASWDARYAVIGVTP